MKITEKDHVAETLKTFPALKYRRDDGAFPCVRVFRMTNGSIKCLIGYGIRFDGATEAQTKMRPQNGLWITGDHVDGLLTSLMSASKAIKEIKLIPTSDA